MTEYTLDNLPKRDWNKRLELVVEVDFENRKGGIDTETLRIYSVEPQAHLIGVTKPVGMLEGLPMDSILVKAFEKNYKSKSSKPAVVENYGFVQKHGEPLELVGYTYESIYDRACEAEMNRYRHNSKNYESGRYVNYLKHGLTIVFPDDVVSDLERSNFIHSVVLEDFIQYVRVIKKGGKIQAARRRLGFYVAVESVMYVNLRSLVHMGTQRSELSPNGREAEPQINKVVTDMITSIEPYLPRFYETVVSQLEKGYR